MLYDEFKQAVKQILDPEGAAGGGLVAIPVVRRALGPRLAAEEFDVFLWALQRDGFVHLLTHVDASQLIEADRQASLNHPSGALLYWVCWI